MKQVELCQVNVLIVVIILIAKKTNQFVKFQLESVENVLKPMINVVMMYVIKVQEDVNNVQ